MNLSEHFLSTMMEASASRVLELAGLSSNEITYNKGKQRFGRWFIEEVESGRLKPTRCGGGDRYTTRFFRISDILAHKASQEGAEIIF